MYEVQKVWKDWQIVRLIGQGSFGSVYEIVRNNFGIEEHSALKVITIPNSPAEIQSLRNEGMDEQSVTAYYNGLVQDFVREIALMSKLKGNLNIVAYEDYAVIQHENEVGWDILIRMELLTPFSKVIHQLSHNDVIKLAISLCDALIVCHKNRILHRDIKIDNIFVSKDGVYKLGDFGVARNVEKTAGELSKKGTYAYMAPEVYKGDDYGISVDIYSLGMVMYRLLNYNREPFLPLPPAVITFDEKNKALVKRMKGEKFNYPANANDELSRIILKACAFLPQERFSSAEEMKAALNDYQKNISDNLMKECSEETDNVEKIPEPCENVGQEYVFSRKKEDDDILSVINNSSQTSQEMMRCSHCYRMIKYTKYCMYCGALINKKSFSYENTNTLLRKNIKIDG